MGLLVSIETDPPLPDLAAMVRLVRAAETDRVDLTMRLSDPEWISRIVDGTVEAMVRFSIPNSPEGRAGILAYMASRRSGCVHASHAGAILRLWRDLCRVDGLAADPGFGEVRHVEGSSGPGQYTTRTDDVAAAIALWEGTAAGEILWGWVSGASPTGLRAFLSALGGGVELDAPVSLDLAVSLARAFPDVHASWAVDGLDLSWPDRMARVWGVHPIADADRAEILARFDHARAHRPR